MPDRWGRRLEVAQQADYGGAGVPVVGPLLAQVVARGAGTLLGVFGDGIHGVEHVAQQRSGKPVLQWLTQVTCGKLRGRLEASLIGSGAGKHLAVLVGAIAAG